MLHSIALSDCQDNTWSRNAERFTFHIGRAVTPGSGGDSKWRGHVSTVVELPLAVLLTVYLTKATHNTKMPVLLSGDCTSTTGIPLCLQVQKGCLGMITNTNDRHDYEYKRQA